MPQPKATPATPSTDGDAKAGRVSFQLDKETADKLDRVAAYLGAEAGKALDMVVKLDRTAVVRSLIDAKVRQMETAEAGTDATS